MPKAPSWWYHSLAPRPAAWATLVLPLRLGCPTHGPTPFCGAPRIRHYHHTEKPRNKISTIIRCSIGPPCGTTHGSVSPACIEDANVCSCVASLLNNYRWDYEEGVSKDRPGRCADDTSSLLRLFPHALEYSRVRATYNYMTLCIVPRSACRESSVMKLSALQKASEGRPRERRKSCVQRKLDIMVKKCS